MMKKLLAILLTLLLSVSLVACGGSSEISSNESSASSNEESSQENKQDSNKITFTEQVLFDTENCKITATGIEPDNMWGFTIKLLLENKSDSVTYMYAIDTATVDGIESDPMFATEVAPGKKANEEVNFTDSILEDVAEFTDIQLNFRVYNSDDWVEDSIVEESVHIYPYGEENATTYKRETKDTDTVLIDTDKVLAVITEYDADSMWGYSGKLFIENRTDKVLGINVDDSSVNGFMIDPFFGTSVEPGACKFTSIDWPSSELEDNNITEVDEIEFKLTAHDDAWDGETYFEDNIILHP